MTRAVREIEGIPPCLWLLHASRTLASILLHVIRPTPWIWAQSRGFRSTLKRVETCEIHLGGSQSVTELERCSLGNFVLPGKLKLNYIKNKRYHLKTYYKEHYATIEILLEIKNFYMSKQGC